MSATI